MAKIHFLNVDEGDCSIIEHDNGNVTMMTSVVAMLKRKYLRQKCSVQILLTGLGVIIIRKHIRPILLNI